MGGARRGVRRRARDDRRELVAGGPRREPPAIARRQTSPLALAELESSRSHFDRRELICALANRLPERRRAEALSAAADRLPRLRARGRARRPADPSQPTYYTTPRLWELERRFCEIAAGGEGAGAGRVSAATLAAVLARHPYLGADQGEMVRRLAAGGERVVAVAALPGDRQDDRARRRPGGLGGGGLPGDRGRHRPQRLGELADAGIPATSIAALLIRAGEWESAAGEPLAPRHRDL